MTELQTKNRVKRQKVFLFSKKKKIYLKKTVNLFFQNEMYPKQSFIHLVINRTLCRQKQLCRIFSNYVIYRKSFQNFGLIIWGYMPF